MKKPEPQTEYDFRAGVRGKHHCAFTDSASANRVPRESANDSTKKPRDQAPKPVKH